MEAFKNLGLSYATLKVLEEKGFETPTEIQKQTIPAILLGKKDIIGQAQTGTGKTAAFGLPILENMEKKPNTVQALVLAPTRELAVQVAEEMYSLKGSKDLSIVPIYGGQSMVLQLRRLKKGADIVVGTPGRIIDHLKRKSLRVDGISFLVLDEADEMLNMGFQEDVEKIMSKTPENKRTLLFSATMPKPILNIAKNYMKDYDILKVAAKQLTVTQTDQIYFEVSERDKFEALCRIIDIEDKFYGLIFCRTKVDADRVSSRLIERGYDADALHGDIPQGQREKILGRFKKKVSNILIATDVAARGIDVHDLTHVINFALPQDFESYVHRIGRTGRAGKEGIAVTFITPSEYRKLQFIKEKTKADIKRAKLPQVKDIIQAKKTRIMGKIKGLIDAKLTNECIEMAGGLLKENEPAKVLAALLQFTFEDELSEKSYKEIDAVRSSVDITGTTRLFVKQGKETGMTKDKLTEILQKKCKISLRAIKDIYVLDAFAFITLPFKEAEIVLEYFKRAGDRSPLITKAKHDKRGGGGGGRSSGRKRSGGGFGGSGRRGGKPRDNKKFGGQRRGKK